MFLFAPWSLIWGLRLIVPSKKDQEAYTETQEGRVHPANSDLRGRCRAVALREQRKACCSRKIWCIGSAPEEKGSVGWHHGASH